MVIGVAAVCIIGWHFIAGPTGTSEEVTRQLLDGIGVALAAAAVIELAYTLFTEGPDEALDPLMLGIAATLIIQLGKYPEPQGADAADLLLLGTLLAVLFLVRLALSERHDGADPNIWWIRRLRRRTAGDTTHASPPDQGHEDEST
jgi:hypothetical protein